MNIKQNKRGINKRIVFIVLLFVLICIGIYFGVIYKNSIQQKTDKGVVNQIDYNKATNEQVDAGEKAKEDFVDNADDLKKQDNTNSLNSKVANITITNVNNTGKILKIRTMIDGRDGDGVCRLSLSDINGKVVEKTSKTVIQSSYTLCEGFDVNIAELSKGEWTANIQYNGSLGTGSVSQTVSI